MRSLSILNSLKDPFAKVSVVIIALAAPSIPALDKFFLRLEATFTIFCQFNGSPITPVDAV